MDVYDIFMFPLEKLFLGRFRSDIAKYAEKNVLEVGVGNGANFQHYDFSKITKFTCLDIELSKSLEKRLKQQDLVHFVSGNAEQLPFLEQTFDCVVMTLVLCSVDANKCISEIKRVLKPNGVFIFIEHVRPTGKNMGKIVDKFNHRWHKFANGCNINRQTDAIIKSSGFTSFEIKEYGVFRYGIAKK